MKSIIVALAASSAAATCENDATWRYKGKPSKSCDWVAEARRRCFKEPKRGELPATEACPETCGTYDQCMRIADLEEALADVEREQELAANSSCPEAEPEWLFSQIAPNCTLDLDGGKLTMRFPTWGSSNMTTAHTLAYKDRPSRKAIQLPNTHFEETFETTFSNDKDYPNAAFLATAKDSPDGVVNIIMVIDGVSLGPTDGVVIYDIYQADDHKDVSLTLPGVTEYVGCGLDIDGVQLNKSPAQIVECFRGDLPAGATYCGTCCPACTAVDTDSFKVQFAKKSMSIHGGTWSPVAGISGCVCLDLAVTGYQYQTSGDIYLTPSSDCARITGDSNQVYGDPGNTIGGDDAVFVDGDFNTISGAGGNDHIVVDGSGGFLWGEDGDDHLEAIGSNLIAGGYDNDVCTSVGSNTFYEEVYTGTEYKCECCYGSDAPTTEAPATVPASVQLNELDCSTGQPIQTPQVPYGKMQCLMGQADSEFQGVCDFCQTCCPECTAVDASNFESHFEQSNSQPWRPKDPSTCICLNLEDAHGYYAGDKGSIEMTDKSDCVRIAGGYATSAGGTVFNLAYSNYVDAKGGDDAMYVKGNYNYFFGGDGHDFISAHGDSNNLYGDGDADELTIWSGSNGVIDGGDGTDACKEAEAQGSNTFQACENCFHGQPFSFGTCRRKLA